MRNPWQWLRHKNLQFDLKYNYSVQSGVTRQPNRIIWRHKHTIWHRIEDIPAKSGYYWRRLLICIGLRQKSDWILPHKRNRGEHLLFPCEIQDRETFNKEQDNYIKEFIRSSQSDSDAINKI